jgi:hypothetical protein
MPNISDGVRFVSWQGHGAAVLCVPHVQSAGAGDIQHGPAVTVRFPSANSTRNTVAPSPASSPPRPTSPRSRGLLALMLLHHARRASRTGPAGRLVPLAEQNRPRWDTGLIAEGVAILQTALARDRLGEYQAQAAIAALHADAPSTSETDWVQIVEWYDKLLLLTASPVVRLNRAVAVGEADGPRAGLAGLAEPDPELPRHPATVRRSPRASQASSISGSTM